MIRKGDRVENKRNHKVGTATQDEHETMNGTAVYVSWDGAKTRYPCPVNSKNLRVIDQPEALTNDQLQAAFLAARGYGKILDDEVLTAIITAAQKVGA